MPFIINTNKSEDYLKFSASGSIANESEEVSFMNDICSAVHNSIIQKIIIDMTQIKYELIKDEKRKIVDLGCNDMLKDLKNLKCYVICDSKESHVADFLSTYATNSSFELIRVSSLAEALD